MSHNPRLSLLGNCIGNPSDTPQRSLEILKNADLLVFEEDRGARLALKTAGIHREYLKLSEHNQTDTLDDIKQSLIDGKWVAYMSDQGMPTVADPGSNILKLGYELGAKVSVVPGPSSITAALSACPFLENSFHYAGFLEREDRKRQKQLKTLLRLEDPIVILDTPYRLKALLQSLLESAGKNREALLALDISGPSEEFIFDSIEGLFLHSKKLTEKLNFVLIIKGEPTMTRSFQRDNKNQKRNKGKR